MVRCEEVKQLVAYTVYSLSVWCENGTGEQVLAGTATCTVPLCGEARP